MAQYITIIYLLSMQGSKTVISDSRNVSLTDRISRMGRNMLELQQRIWDLDEEIKISQGQEQAEYIIKQNKLREEYAAIKKEKNDLEGGKIKPYQLKDHTITEYGCYVPKNDSPIQKLNF